MGKLKEGDRVVPCCERGEPGVIITAFPVIDNIYYVRLDNGLVWAYSEHQLELEDPLAQFVREVQSSQ